MISDFPLRMASLMAFGQWQYDDRPRQAGSVGCQRPMELISLEKDAKVSPQLQDRADRLVQVAAGDREWTQVVEEKRSGQPRDAAGWRCITSRSARWLACRERKYYSLNSEGRNVPKAERRQWLTVHNSLCKLWKRRPVLT